MLPGSDALDSILDLSYPQIDADSRRFGFQIPAFESAFICVNLRTNPNASSLSEISAVLTFKIIVRRVDFLPRILFVYFVYFVVFPLVAALPR